MFDEPHTIIVQYVESIQVSASCRDRSFFLNRVPAELCAHAVHGSGFEKEAE